MFKITSRKNLITACAWCQRILSSQGAWVEESKAEFDRCNAKFTHGICPECSAEVIAQDDALEPYYQTMGYVAVAA